MEVNKHINFLKRRGLLIEQSSQLSLDFPVEEYLNFKLLCSQGSEVFCKLVDLADKHGIKEDPKLSKKLVDSITKIYKYLKPPIKNNKSKFSRLVSVILNQKIENAINTFDIIADSIDNINVGGLRKQIAQLTDEEIELSDDVLLKIIDQIKHQTYVAYENSFVGSHFESYRTRLELSYLGGEILNQKFTELLEGVISGDIDKHKLVGWMYENILNNFNKGIGKFIKADLKCKKPLVDESGNVVIGVGDYVEVKKLDYRGDSYLSEFFAIHKNPDKLSDNLKTEEGVLVYNNIIDSLYLRLHAGGDDILKTIHKGFAGIIYDENRFIPKEYVRLYWSNKGQRIDDHRLSIRYKINSNKFRGYIYEPNNDVLKYEEITTDIPTEDILLPLTVNESINEDTVSDKKGKDWNLYSPQGKMIRTKGGTKELDDDFDWAKQFVSTIPDKPEVYALIQHLGVDEVLGENFQEGYLWYGNHVSYELENGERWVVGTETSMGNALYEYWDTYIDDVGYGSLGIDLRDFIDVSDYWIDSFCEEETDSYMDDWTDKEIMEHYSYELNEYDEEYKETEKEYENILEEIKQYNELLETMEIQNQDYLAYGYEEPQHTEEDFEHYSVKIEELENLMGLLKKKLDEISYNKYDYINNLKNQIEEDYKDGCQTCMQDPLHCLVYDRGLYRTESQAIEDLGFGVDRNGLIEYLSGEYTNYGDLSGYGNYYEETVGDTNYILIQIS